MKEKGTYAGSLEGEGKTTWILFLEFMVVIAVIFSFIAVIQLGLSGEKAGSYLPEHKLFLRYR